MERSREDFEEEGLVPMLELKVEGDGSGIREWRGAVGLGIQVFDARSKISLSWRRYQNSWYTCISSLASFLLERASAEAKTQSLIEGRITSFQVGFMGS